MAENKLSETSLVGQLEYIKSNCEKLRGQSINLINSSKNTPWVYSSLCEEVDTIVEEYNWIVPYINNFLKEAGFSFELQIISKINANFKEMRDGNTYPPIDNKLIKISLKCNKILSILKNLATPTKESKKNFEDLKKELKEIEKDISKIILRDLYEAIGEFESNKILGAVLICGRIIIFNLDSIKGNINEKIDEMKRVGVIEAKGGSAEWVIKTNQKARGLFSHDVNHFPTPSEALAILGDTIKITKIVAKYKKQINKQ